MPGLSLDHIRKHLAYALDLIFFARSIGIRRMILHAPAFTRLWIEMRVTV